MAAANLPWNHQKAFAEEQSPWQELGLQASTEISCGLPLGCQIPSPSEGQITSVRHQMTARCLAVLCAAGDSRPLYQEPGPRKKTSSPPPTNNSFPSDFKREKEDYYPQPPKSLHQIVRNLRATEKRRSKRLKKRRRRDLDICLTSVGQSSDHHTAAPPGCDEEAGLNNWDDGQALGFGNHMSCITQTHARKTSKRKRCIPIDLVGSNKC